MYEEIFRSKARPFRATPDAHFYFAHNNIEMARQATLQAVSRAAGPALILGGVGLGKSMLCQVLERDLQANYDVVNLVSARLGSREELLQGILFELQLPYKQLSEGELRLAILDYLQPNPAKPSEGIVILVDEAQCLPLDLLDELRLISNFTRDNQPRAQVVLFGNMQLEEIFSRPELESFNQRLAARCYLAPMNPGETRAYVEHQLTRASIPVESFMDQAALDSVFVGSEGVPRIANQLLDQAMLLAGSKGEETITSSLIEEAWSDLQQLPVPWQSMGEQRVSEFPSSQESAEQASTVAPTDETETDEHNTFVELPDLDVLADEIANAKRTSYEVEFGELQEEGTEDAASEKQLDASEENYEEIIGVGLQTPDAIVSGYELSCQIEVIDGASITFDLNEDGLEASSELAESADKSEISAANLEQEPSGAEEQEVMGEPQNFFAAFNPPEDGELPASVQQALIQPISAPQSEEADGNPSHLESDALATEQNEEEPDVLPVDSFFSARPTDEKMIAFEQEQVEFQSMGVWENDPPAVPTVSELHANQKASQELMDAFDRTLSGDPQEESATGPDAASNDSVQAAETAQTTQVIEQVPEPKATEEALFGSDFDEELSLEELAKSPSTTFVSPYHVAETFSQSLASAQTGQTDELVGASSEADKVEDQLAGEPAEEKSGDSTNESEQLIATSETLGADTTIVASTFDGNWDPAPGAGDAGTKRPEEQIGVVESEGENPEENQVEFRVGRETGVEQTQNFSRLAEVAESQDSDFVPGILAANTTPKQTVELREEQIAQAQTPALDEQDQVASPDVSHQDDSDETWSTDVVSVDTAHEIELQNEIGDMLEQLNFRGIGGFSEEQISSHPRFNAENPSEENETQGNTAGRYGEPVLRTSSTAEELFSDRAEMYDDDRDMLVIEDEVVRPVATTTALGTKKTSRTKSYSQLFAKLRK